MWELTVKLMITQGCCRQLLMPVGSRMQSLQKAAAASAIAVGLMPSSVCFEEAIRLGLACAGSSLRLFAGARSPRTCRRSFRVASDGGMPNAIQGWAAACRNVDLAAGAACSRPSSRCRHCGDTCGAWRAPGEVQCKGHKRAGCGGVLLLWVRTNDCENMADANIAGIDCRYHRVSCANTVDVTQSKAGQTHRLRQADGAAGHDEGHHCMQALQRRQRLLAHRQERERSRQQDVPANGRKRK